jgi:hypothetical protein
MDMKRRRRRAVTYNLVGLTNKTKQYNNDTRCTTIRRLLTNTCNAEELTTVEHMKQRYVKVSHYTVEHMKQRSVKVSHYSIG